MGITVFSGTPAASLSSGLPAAIDAAAAASAEGIAAIDFAGLLAQQMLGSTANTLTTGPSPLSAIATALNPGAAIAAAARTLADERQPDDKGDPLTDTLLPPDLAALAIPPTVPATALAPATAGARDNAESALPADLLSAGRNHAPALAADSRPGAQALAAKDAPAQAVAALTPGTDESAKIAAPVETSASGATSFAETLAAQATAVPVRRHETMSQAPMVEVPVGERGWSKNFSDSVVWVSRQEVQSAQLNLNPPHLGPVQVTLNVSGDQVTAAFVSPHAEVRQAIQDALPQLREMLAGAGINLGQANIGAQLQQQQQPPTPQASDSARFAGDNAILQGATGEAASMPTLVSRGRGLVDLFA